MLEFLCVIAFIIIAFWLIAEPDIEYYTPFDGKDRGKEEEDE